LGLGLEFIKAAQARSGRVITACIPATRSPRKNPPTPPSERATVAMKVNKSDPTANKLPTSNHAELLSDAATINIPVLTKRAMKAAGTRGEVC
jgi:hypothetical protein